MGETVLLVGCGNMGRAMLAGWLKARPGLDAHVVEPAEALRDQAAALGAKAVASAEALPGGLKPTLIVLAVKPQVMAEVIPAYAGYEGATFVSVAAGTTVATLKAGLGAGAPVIRCMPNTPAAIGAGMMVVFASTEVAADRLALAEALFACSGEVARIGSESLMDAVTAVSGSGPAYVFHMIEALAEAGAAAGLPAALSLILARQTVMGAGKLAAESGVDPAELRRQVTSPNGTTAAGLSVLMGEGGLGPLMVRTVAAAKRRGEELAQG